jgi:hypothetical protein
MPWQNATDESFNRKVHNEYLSLQWFRNQIEATVGIAQWRSHYDEVRPRSSLGYRTRAEFKSELSNRAPSGHRCPVIPGPKRPGRAGARGGARSRRGGVPRAQLGAAHVLATNDERRFPMMARDILARGPLFALEAPELVFEFYLGLPVLVTPDYQTFAQRSPHQGMSQDVSITGAFGAPLSAG